MKKAALLLYMCMLPLTLAGCGGVYSNYREIEQLQLVRALGIDRCAEGFMLTVASAKSPEGGEPPLISASGASIGEAIEKMNVYSGGRELFIAHVEHILIGEDAASGGIGEILGYVQRSTLMRMSTGLYIVRASTAQSVMTAAAEAGFSIGEALSALEHSSAESGLTGHTSCLDASRFLTQRGACLVGALCLADAGGHLSPVPEGGILAPAGFAILGGSSLAGYIEPENAPAALILSGGSPESVFTVPDGEGGTAALKLTKCGAELRPLSGGQAGAVARITLEASLIELSEPRYSMSAGYLSGLGRALAREIQSEAESVIETSSLLSLDFLGLGEAARRGALSASEPENFPHGTFTAEVSADVVRSSDLEGSVRYGEEAGG